MDKKPLNEMGHDEIKEAVKESAIFIVAENRFPRSDF